MVVLNIIKSVLPLIFTGSALPPHCFYGFLLARFLACELPLFIPRDPGCNYVPLLEFRYLVEVLHNLFLVFLHGDHFFPLSLSDVPDFPDGHDADLLDVVIDLFNEEGLLVYRHKILALIPFNETFKLFIAFLSFGLEFIFFVDEIDSLIGRV